MKVLGIPTRRRREMVLAGLPMLHILQQRAPEYLSLCFGLLHMGLKNSEPLIAGHVLIENELLQVDDVLDCGGRAAAQLHNQMHELIESNLPVELVTLTIVTQENDVGKVYE